VKAVNPPFVLARASPEEGRRCRQGCRERSTRVDVCERIADQEYAHRPPSLEKLSVRAGRRYRRSLSSTPQTSRFDNPVKIYRASSSPAMELSTAALLYHSSLRHNIFADCAGRRALNTHSAGRSRGSGRRARRLSNGESRREQGDVRWALECRRGDRSFLTHPIIVAQLAVVELLKRRG